MLLVAVSTGASLAAQDTTVDLTLDQAPRAVFPAARIESKDVPSTPAFRTQLQAKLGRVRPTIWEPSYHTFIARKDNVVIGYAVVVNEIGKAAPITLIVSSTPDFKVRDVAVMVYREVRGDEIRQPRFLKQYRGKRGSDPIELDRDIVGITGATLSVHGTDRAVHKALGILELVYR
jgi:Na+-translocating ferredoxin:NAD+ oxidoreductase RnfG subunit